MTSGAPERCDVAGAIGKRTKLNRESDHEVSDPRFTTDSVSYLMELGSRQRARAHENHDAIRQASRAPEGLPLERPLPSLESNEPGMADDPKLL